MYFGLQEIIKNKTTMVCHLTQLSLKVTICLYTIIFGYVCVVVLGECCFMFGFSMFMLFIAQCWLESYGLPSGPSPTKKIMLRITYERS